MKNFVRQQKISDVTGRVDYLKREGNFKDGSEDLIYFEENFSEWEKLAKFENTQPQFTNQARELIVALPNEMYDENLKNIGEKEKKEIEELVKNLIGDQPHLYAIQWNEKKTNLHMHLLFSERKKTFEELEPKRYRRDIWLDKDTGKMAKKNSPNAYLARKKGDIQRDKDGNIKYKEPEASGFTDKDKYFSTKKFNHAAKEITHETLKSFNYEVEMYDSKTPYLAEKHVGKGDNEFTRRVSKENEYIREYNQTVEQVLASNRVEPNQLMKVKDQTIKEFRKGLFDLAIARIKQILERVRELMFPGLDKDKIKTRTKTKEKSRGLGLNSRLNELERQNKHDRERLRPKSRLDRGLER